MTPENTLFELPDDQDHIFKARDHLPLVLYFYPRDNTPGCSIEGQEFTTLQGEYKKLGYEIAGVSRNSVESHQKFRIKKSLGIILLSDPEGKVCRQYGVVKEKSLFGKISLGIERSTFVLDKDGQIIIEERKVKALGHARRLLKKLKEITKKEN